MLTECGNLPTPELLEQTRHELGLDQPFLVQYGSWVKGVLTGDMGTSYAFKVPVTEKLMKCFWPTLQMSLFALLLMILFSIPCGILSAVYQNKWPDYLIRGITFFGVSIPSFWIGLILLSIFGVQLRWINVAGGTTDFKAMIYNAITGTPDAVEENGEAVRLYQNLWTARSEEEYIELYGYATGMYENAYSCDDLMEVIRQYNENADPQSFKELTEASDLESAKKRILG